MLVVLLVGLILLMGVSSLAIAMTRGGKAKLGPTVQDRTEEQHSGDERGQRERAEAERERESEREGESTTPLLDTTNWPIGIMMYTL